ncbi:sulfite exporter TauE/SafE family protein [Amorphus sp. 3PC139-8]|uniref:sulfite exporter TauE/SafE family protein n=1 Tax=Amorphus sp. 3PC139-8 TaxID=2735676 RepID=UPI00345D6EC8
MDGSTIAVLISAGVLGGAANAIAGGGTFFTFPALIATGLDPVTANASNAIAIYPGHAAAVPAYRRELRMPGRTLLRRAAIAAVGGSFGALLLLATGEAAFTELVPWLLALATAIFWAAAKLNRLIARMNLDSPSGSTAIQFIFAVYGGYFGAGLGVLLMAALTMIGVSDVQSANAQKNLLAAVITTISAAIFIGAELVHWPSTVVVLLGAVAGGYLGARLARHIPARVLRGFIVSLGLVLSVYYFVT